ncbi:MAG: chemotaxis protein [Gammaproteobacteria bacterium]
MASILDTVDERTQLVGQNRLELLMFRLRSQQRFGINVFKVREVIQCPPLTVVPQSHHVVRGVANIRGLTITVMDMAAAVGLPPIEDPSTSWVVVTEYNRAIQGFLVSGVDRIININWNEIKPPPKGMGRHNYMTAVTEIDGELVEVIDVEQVMADIMNIHLEVSEDFISFSSESDIQYHALVVDDSSVARHQVTGVLDQLGVTYDIGENGSEGLNILKESINKGEVPTEKYSMVISDVEMPSMDGYSFTKAIKDHPELRDLYVCLHTSVSGNFNNAMAERVGANKLVPKFSPDELASTVVERLKELEQELEQA